MRFCQTDGTPLVEDAPPVDPYKTMVARPEDIAAAIPPLKPEEPVEAAAPEPDEDVLQIPPVEAPDPKKTMYASEAEIRSAMADVDIAEEPVMDIPPVAEPEPPKFIEPNLTPPAASGLPPSPFSSGDRSKTTPPIPSPFNVSGPIDIEQPKPSFEPPMPEPPSFVQPEPPAPAFNPFENAAPEVNAPMVQAEWTPTPAAQEQSWQDESMQNPQYQPGSAVQGGGQNQTLAIISLVVGILSLFCCAWFIPGIVAIVLGFLARGKANSDPGNYGGAGLALGGIIAGGVSLLLGAIVLVLYFLGFAASMMQGM